MVAYSPRYRLYRTYDNTTGTSDCSTATAIYTVYADADCCTTYDPWYAESVLSFTYIEQDKEPIKPVHIHPWMLEGNKEKLGRKLKMPPMTFDKSKMVNAYKAGRSLGS